ncbi:hypothetical protein ASC95_14605 [Pelomonas sp. Root1217]|uniref:hypothetical protein n=1 Tax=Pelomonas sp. Root1217 TaxID=1736430 RepID=UPI00070F0769|nr:hypothetical protein [Pelomonas sp. Root1217]KQV50589.1 hypothetical protein ASC95_14605 [Pelomonas sp. Root1217]
MRRQIAARLAKPRHVFVTPGGDEFAAWCRDLPGTAVELVISARALHELVTEPGLPLADLDAVQAYAQQQFAHYFGSAAQRFAIAPWKLGEAAGASALHGLDLAALRSQADAAHVRLAAVRPAWAAWLASLPAATRAGTGRAVWHEGDVAVVIQLDGGRVTGLQSRRVQQLADLGGDAPLAVGTPADELIAQPGPATPQPDFLPRNGRSPLAWPLAATGALVLATAAWSAVDSHRGLDVAQAARDRVATLRPAVVAKPAARGRGEPAENRAGNEARALLAMPWEPLLTRVEIAGAEAKTIAWLGLDASAGRGELRLEGLTTDKLLALQLAEQLGTTPGWRQVVLSRFSAAETGLVGQRFEINARVATGSGS